jgi:hypothetical protein
MDAAASFRPIAGNMIHHLVSAAMLLVQGVMSRGRTAGARTFESNRCQLLSDSRIDEFE